ncbi:MAG TPA: MltA domain-containing protein [Planctomycetota bacterium]|jgi:membrane-bound lytic murein transglycosylase A|nr:MltA domain-containing protein [Planctomycetota bacterium]
MKLNLLCTVLLLASAACKTVPDYGRALPPGAPALIALKPGEAHPDFGAQWRERDDLAPAVEQSIEFMKRKSAPRYFPIENVSHERALASLERYRDLLAKSGSEQEFARALDAEFQVYKSAGWDGKGGGVLFTGYCTPILDGRLAQDANYRYPLYALPPDLAKGPEGEILGRKTDAGVEPYPTRRAIEASAMLAGKGLELAWLRDPLDAYIAHVNGSAFIRLQNGELYRLGYAGKNGQRYTSLGQELVKEGKLKKDEVSLASIRRWASEHPGEVESYLARNDSYVFFTKIDGNPHGSLNVPVTSGRSLATDKTLFPRGSVVFVEGRVGKGSEARELHRFMLDQDTGGAIRTAGRADVYLGIGPEAERSSGATRVEGQLYYLFLKDGVAPQP